MVVNGIQLALLEVGAFGILSHTLRNVYWDTLQTIPVISYYWFMFTILTGIWESVFVMNYSTIVEQAKLYILQKQHTWTNRFKLSYLLPWKFSGVFYAEYGAWADREYMTRSNRWSRLIESSHALCCGIFSFLTIYYAINQHTSKYYISASIAMGTQFMNSILYLGNYCIQTKDLHNVNYNQSSFPVGPFWLRRPFMLINILWFLMPFCILLNFYVSTSVY